MAASLTEGVPALGTPILTEAAQDVETWPAESDVRLGVTYGPTGAEYTGTMAEGGGSYPTADQIATAVLAAFRNASPMVPVNTEQIHGIQLTGAGISANPMRPV